MRPLMLIGIASSVLVAACGPDRQPLTEEQLELRRELLPELQYTIDGVTYAVRKRPGPSAIYEVTTKGSRPGTEAGVFQAVRQAYGCQSITLIQTSRNWRSAEARGAFCKTRN
jgi:hypothetical protein